MKKDDKHYSILVIEDNPGDFMIVKELLKEKIADPEIVHSKNFKAASALLMMGDFHFDCIFLDLTLPDKSGRKLLSDMLPIVSACPVIVLTGLSDLDFSIESISLGATDYLLKDELTASMLYKSLVYAIERKRTSASLKESENRYRHLFHLSPQPMCLYDSNSYLITAINKASMDHYGYKLEEFLTMTLFDLVPADDRPVIIDFIKGQNRSLNETYKGVFRTVKKSGEIITVESYSTPLLVNNQLLTLVIAIDVTEKILHEHAITKAIIKAQENERYEIGGELHDNVCQILAATLLNLDVLKRSASTSELDLFTETRSYIVMAADEIRNLSHRLAPAFFNNSTLEQAIEALLKTFNVDNRYSVALTIDPDLTKQFVDQDLQLNLYRILQEALKNILKYSNADGITIVLGLHDGNYLLQVADNGTGFDMADHGNGIGISNMKRRAELFSGTFNIQSAKSKGCTITVLIPIKANPQLL